MNGEGGGGVGPEQLVTTEKRDIKPLFKIPLKYDHSQSYFDSPQQDSVLKEIRDGIIKQDHPVSLFDLRRIISAEVKDIKDQKDLFLKEDADSDLLRRIDRVTRAKEYLEQNVDLDQVVIDGEMFMKDLIDKDYDEVHPFDKKARDLEELERITENLSKPQEEQPDEDQLKKLREYVNFHRIRTNELGTEVKDPKSVAMDIVDGNYVIFNQFHLALQDYPNNDLFKRDTSEGLKEIREKDDTQLAFDFHPYFAHLEFEEEKPTSEKGKIISELENMVKQGEQLDFLDIERLLTAELHDYTQEWHQLQNEVNAANNYFTKNPDANRFTVFVSASGERTTTPPPEGSTNITTLFYNRDSMPAIKTKLQEIRELTHKGKPPLIRNAQKMAVRLARGEEMTKPDIYDKHKLPDFISILDIHRKRFSGTPLYASFQHLQAEASQILSAARPAKTGPGETDMVSLFRRHQLGDTDLQL